MSESLGGLGPVGGTGKAPSLFSGAAAKSDRQPERISILSSLDAGGVSGRSGRAIGRPVLFILAGLLLVCSAIVAMRWVLHEEVPARMIETAPPQSTSALPIAVVDQGSQAATIENVSPTSSAEDSVPGGILTAEPETRTAQDQGVLPPEAGNRMPLMALTDSNSVARLRSAGAGSASEARPAPKNGSAKRTQGRSSEKGKATAVPDSDAALLAALVAYDASTPIVVKPAPAPSAKRGDESARNRNSGFDPKRDVVVDDKNVSMAELVRRCGTLGLVEGFLCKARVCSSRQGSDPACPQPAEPSVRGG